MGKTEDLTTMIKLQGLSREQVREISRQIAKAFYNYKYNEAGAQLRGTVSYV